MYVNGQRGDDEDEYMSDVDGTGRRCVTSSKMMKKEIKLLKLRTCLIVDYYDY